ncbi:hypothetical protein CPB83DRAFT_850008 [Crepidotus variabilis]|uniref:Uncharacterized protein n=1 Tax=Crepidotus variabilis TaxID=179855 RepID=A0A9P6JSY5_9AGAR|nr:hypothetical protein CPB83DRAFT_850008 [Crepidotus variabilis]
MNYDKNLDDFGLWKWCGKEGLVVLYFAWRLMFFRSSFIEYKSALMFLEFSIYDLL